MTAANKKPFSKWKIIGISLFLVFVGMVALQIRASRELISRVEECYQQGVEHLTALKNQGKITEAEYKEALDNWRCYD